MYMRFTNTLQTNRFDLYGVRIYEIQTSAEIQCNTRLGPVLDLDLYQTCTRLGPVLT